MTNDRIQKLINKQVRRVRKRGWKIWFRPHVRYMPKTLRQALREHPDRIDEFIENYRRLEHDF